MRDLTAKQKKVLNGFIKSCRTTDEQKILTNNAPFITPDSKPTWRLGVDDLPYPMWEQLKRINDTEILSQEVERYLFDESWKDEIKA